MAPGFARFDNGPEYIANAVAAWCRFSGTASISIDPGSPWQNAWIKQARRAPLWESYYGRFRDEFLNGRHFDNARVGQLATLRAFR